MANILTNKPAEPPKIEQVALFHLFEFEGDEKTIVCLKPTRIGRGGMQVNPGWKPENVQISKPMWLYNNINITEHLRQGSYVSVEKQGELNIIVGFPELKK